MLAVFPLGCGTWLCKVCTAYSAHIRASVGRGDLSQQTARLMGWRWAGPSSALRRLVVTSVRFSPSAAFFPAFYAVHRGQRLNIHHKARCLCRAFSIKVHLDKHRLWYQKQTVCPRKALSSDHLGLPWSLASQRTFTWYLWGQIFLNDIRNNNSSPVSESPCQVQRKEML